MSGTQHTCGNLHPLLGAGHRVHASKGLMDKCASCAKQMCPLHFLPSSLLSVSLFPVPSLLLCLPPPSPMCPCLYGLFSLAHDLKWQFTVLLPTLLLQPRSQPRTSALSISTPMPSSKPSTCSEIPPLRSQLPSVPATPSTFCHPSCRCWRHRSGRILLLLRIPSMSISKFCLL